MGNKILRPPELQPFAGFSDQQINYLKDKFEALSDQKKLLNVDKIADILKTSAEQASKILNYIDFQGQGSVDFYEFVCAAASLHQNDAEAREFVFEIYGGGKEMDQISFGLFFGTIFRYLHSLNVIQEQYKPQIGEAKFKQYDYNKNGTIGFDQFQSMLQSDTHCRLWMETLGFAAESNNEIRQDKVVNQQLAKQEEFGVVAEEGDQFLATNAWTKVCDQMAPIGKKDYPQNKVPNVNMDIGYVYGYRSYDTRDNLRYNADGQVVYHTAACGIVLHKGKNTMKVCTEHNDDITCLDINVAKGIVATGEMGRRPALIIWDASNLQRKAVFADKLERNISNVAISKSGKFVAASSMNDKHQIAVYNIATNSLVAFGQGPKSVIYAIKFNQAEDEIICACQKEVVFARFVSGKIQIKKGIFGKAPLEANLAIALVGNSVMTSTVSGLLCQWRGNYVDKVYKQHTKSVSALCQRGDGGLISGDALGNIVLWSSNMSKEKVISLQKLLGKIKSNNIKIISLCEQSNNILVGTRGGQIIEVAKQSNASILMEGHFDQQLWGLCVSSNRNQFYTGGQDKLLIKWDADKRRVITKRKMDNPVNCLDINKQNLLAVGLKNGTVLLLEGTNLNGDKKIVNHKHPDKDVISAVKFSPDGSVLAIGYAPPVSKVYLYDLQSMKKIGECKGASTRVVSVDFSRGGQSLLATSIQPLFYKTSNGAQITSVSGLKQQQWSTMHSKFCWFTQGIWPPCSDGSDVNWVDRANSKKFLVTADDYSLVKVFNYPVCNQRQMYNKYKGHSSHVTSVKFSYDDKLVISTGGLEKSIIQWNFAEFGDVSYDVDYEEDKQQAEQEQEEDYEFQQEQEAPRLKAQHQEGDFGVEIDQGDQALAVKPFEGQVKASTPLNYRPTHKNEPPTQGLAIDHAWGLRNLYINDQVRNQLRYSSNGHSCLFITAALGVEMDLKTRKQTFYQGQSDDLISFDITPDRKFCATGQMAQLNKNKPLDKIVDVHVWDAETKQLKAKLSKFHKRAVILVQFSPSGKKLLTVGQDDKHSLAVYDWQQSRVAWSSPVDGAKVTGAAWKNQKEYITVGLKHVKMWTEGKGVLGKIPGKWDPMFSAVCWGGKFITGGGSGSVYLWAGNQGTATKGHTGVVHCLAVDLKGNLFSGGSEGSIIKWKISGGKLVAQDKIFDLAKIDTVSPGVLSMDFTKTNILVGTNSSSIYELSLSDTKAVPQPLLTSHFAGQLWAQAWAPDRRHFVTAGDDKTIRIWDSLTYKQLHIYQMKDMVRGIDWQQSSGDLIVVGDYKGKLFLFNKSLELLNEKRSKFNRTKPRKQPFWIEDIKFSPDGKYVAFGAHGGASHLQIQEINGNQFGKEIIINAGMTSALLSVDWSQGSDMLVAVSQAYQLKFTNLSKDISASSTRDVKWATWSGKFGFPVKQVHQDVDYSNINCICVNPTKTLVVSGGDDQKIRMFTYPVTIPKQKNKEYVGHSSHVTKVRFSSDQQHLISTGGNDRTIILWKVTGNQVQQQAQEENQAEQDEEMQEQAFEGAEQIDDFPKPKGDKKQEKTKQDEDQGGFGVEQDQGDQFMAVKPWLGAIKEPTKPFYKGIGKPPKVTLDLQYAHGYRTKDCRNNLKYLSPDEISYHTAGLGIVMDISSNPHEQFFFNQHTDDIISMAWNEDKSVMFTGQMGAKPVIHSWDKDGAPLKSFKGVKNGVSALAVGSKYLVASGMDDNHYVFVFDIDKGTLLTSEKGGRDVIIGMKWVDDSHFVSVGVKHYKYWTFEGKSVKGQTGVFGKTSNNILCCVQVKDSKIFTGASDGSLHVWSGNSITKTQKGLHQKAINALCIHKNVLLTGSNDATIKILDLDSLATISTVDCNKLLERSVDKSIRALDAIDNKILIGTLGSQIFELKSNEAIENATQNGQFKLIGNHMNGHYSPNFVTNQVWGLSLYDESTYVTCSDDGTLRQWDIEKKQQIAVIDIKFDQKLGPVKLKPGEKFLPDSVKGRCLAVSEQGCIVVGCKDGTVKILSQKMKPVYSKRISQKQISHIKFSPDKSILAIGSHDTRIYVYNWNDGDIKLKSKSIKHNSYIKHFDFSRDGNQIHSTCGAYQLLFWDANSGKQITSGATQTRDEQWASWNVTLGWPVQGIWQPFMDGTDVNALDRAKKIQPNGMQLLAAGDDLGQVRILEYPCLVKNSQGVKGRGHSSHVTNVLFDNSDKLLFSTGGEDQTVLQWKVQDDS